MVLWWNKLKQLGCFWVGTRQVFIIGSSKHRNLAAAFHPPAAHLHGSAHHCLGNWQKTEDWLQGNEEVICKSSANYISWSPLLPYTPWIPTVEFARVMNHGLFKGLFKGLFMVNDGESAGVFSSFLRGCLKCYIGVVSSLQPTLWGRVRWGPLLHCVLRHRFAHPNLCYLCFSLLRLLLSSLLRSKSKSSPKDASPVCHGVPCDAAPMTTLASVKDTCANRLPWSKWLLGWVGKDGSNGWGVQMGSSQILLRKMRG